MSTTIHTYRTLNTKLREIRVLTLFPRDLHEPVRCTLSTTSLQAPYDYTALSYVWGQAAYPNALRPSIMLDNSRFEVTPNLHAALRRLRSVVDVSYLWIDAICINQKDDDERSTQVAMMRDIYASARKVIIWLGVEDESSDMAFEAMPAVAGLTVWPDQGDESTNADYRSHVGSFFFNLTDRRPWFSRVWCLQELAMASSDPLVMCGSKCVAWSNMLAAWQVVAKESLSGLSMLPSQDDVDGDSNARPRDSERLSLTKLDVLNDLRVAVQSRGGYNLRSLLVASRTSQSTDPRDRIYGMLGLLAPEALDSSSNGVISVNYKKSCVEVYTDAMAHIFSRGEGPYTLSGVFLPGVSATVPHIPSNSTSVEQHHLPSWVPDFSRQVADNATQPSGIIFHPPTTMNASGAGAGAKNGKCLDEKRTLQVEGLFVDTIEEIIPIGSTLNAVIENLTNLERKSNEAKQRPCSFTSAISPFIQQFKNNEPLWRILISNKHFKSGYEPAPPSYEAMYAELLQNESTPSTICVSEENPKTHQPSEYESALASCINRKSFFVTRNGLVGTCAPDSLASDIVVILFGSPTPFVLRELKESISVADEMKQAYLLVGGAYVGGIMGGEMVDELYCEDLMDSTTFFIC